MVKRDMEESLVRKEKFEKIIMHLPLVEKVGRDLMSGAPRGHGSTLVVTLHPPPLKVVVALTIDSQRREGSHLLLPLVHLHLWMKKVLQANQLPLAKIGTQGKSIVPWKRAKKL